MLLNAVLYRRSDGDRSARHCFFLFAAVHARKTACRFGGAFLKSGAGLDYLCAHFLQNLSAANIHEFEFDQVNVVHIAQ